MRNRKPSLATTFASELAALIGKYRQHAPSNKEQLLDALQSAKNSLEEDGEE